MMELYPPQIEFSRPVVTSSKLSEVGDTKFNPLKTTWENVWNH